ANAYSLLTERYGHMKTPWMKLAAIGAGSLLAMTACSPSAQEDTADAEDADSDTIPSVSNMINPVWAFVKAITTQQGSMLMLQKRYFLRWATKKTRLNGKNRQPRNVKICWKTVKST